MNQEDMERLVNKSDRQLFINDLNTGFGLSLVEAEALYELQNIVVSVFQALNEALERITNRKTREAVRGLVIGKIIARTNETSATV